MLEITPIISIGVFDKFSCWSIEIKNFNMEIMINWEYLFFSNNQSAFTVQSWFGPNKPHKYRCYSLEMGIRFFGKTNYN